MSTYSPPDDIKPDIFHDMPTASSSRSSGAPTAGSHSGVFWTNQGPMLRMESAVVETVVTHTTRTTTSFPPIPLPRIPVPEAISKPDHLAPELYPLAQEPAPEDMRVFALNLGGQRVVVRDDNTISPAIEPASASSGPGWTRSYPSGVDPRLERSEPMGLLQAVNRVKGKEARKRPLDYSRSGSRGQTAVPTPPITADQTVATPRRSPPRKKIRGLDDLNIPHDGSNALLSPLPSPDHEAGPSSAPPSQSAANSALSSAAPPSIGSGMEMAALFSLPAMVSHFENLPDKLQQQVLMHLLRRSRMPTIQRTYAFAGIALKRDFISHLPHEVAVQILRKIDTPTLASALRVSKKWHKMIDTERVVWAQRLVDDNLWFGLGVEAEDENIISRRMETLEWKSKAVPRHVKAETPIEDEPMHSARESSSSTAHRPAPLKHVYRRRHTSTRNWLNSRPAHTTFAGLGTNVVTCLQFDADKIISASDDHSINVYNTSNGQLRKRLDGHEGGVWALEYKGDTLVSGSTDRTVRIWDLETYTEAHVFHGHTSTVRCLQIVEPVLDEATGEYYPAYPVLVTGSRDATLRVWKLPKKGEPPMPPQYDAEGNEVQLSPDQNPWHVHALEGHQQAVRSISAHGRICVSGSYDNTVRVWDIVTGTCKHVLLGHEQKVYSVSYDRHRNRCASGSMDNTVKVWNVITGECLHTLAGHTALVGLLGISPNYLVSAAADGSLRVWDALNYELKHTLASHGGAITCFRHDETKVISGSDGTLKLWDIRTGQYVRDLVIGISSVWQVAFNGNLLVAASNRAGTTIFDVFDFGTSTEPFELDDDSLDRLRRPAWERANPREPQEYQVDDIDGVNMTSPLETMNLASPSLSDRFLTETSPFRGAGSRRSSRLAARSGSGGVGSSRRPVVVEPPPRSRRGARFAQHPGAEYQAYSPSPAGPSRVRNTRLGAKVEDDVDEEQEEAEDEEIAWDDDALENRMGNGQSFAPIFDEEPAESLTQEDELMSEDIKEEGL